MEREVHCVCFWFSFQNGCPVNGSGVCVFLRGEKLERNWGGECGGGQQINLEKKYLRCVRRMKPRAKIPVPK